MMERDKKKRPTKKLRCLSLTQNVETSEESLSDTDGAFKSRSSHVRKKTSKASESISVKQETFKSPVRVEETAEETAKKQGSSKSPIKDFCPICQVPLPFIKIPAELHTAHCLIEIDTLPACPDGISCRSVNMFHYRDFHHTELASWRSSPDYVPLEIEYPDPPKSSKKRPSVSPLGSSSKTKKIKTPQSEIVDDPGVPGTSFRKALFQDEPKPGISAPAEIHKPIEAAKEIKTEPDLSPQKSLKCDVTFEYHDEAPVLTSVVSKQSACSVACLTPGDGQHLQAVCTVNIKAPGGTAGGTAQDAASKNPVHVNLLLNESGWEAVQVDGLASARVGEVNISLCKCARAMTLRCCVSGAKGIGTIEHKYSAILSDLGLKKKVEREQEVYHGHDKVDSLKSKNSQLTIRSFFAGNDADKGGEPTKAGMQSNGELLPIKTSAKVPRPKTPMILLAGASASRPLTPIALGAEQPVSKAPARRPSTAEPNRPRRAWGNSTTPVPQYKRIPDTPFVVDAFKWGAIEGVRAYFLSHFHSDHYIGLRKQFNQPIYCSKITANLIRLKIGVDPKFLHILEVGLPRLVGNVEVEVFDANHCPGSLMFLFRLLDGRTFLHVGDFRASEDMERIRSFRQVDVLYLDTTYCDPVYDFPSQSQIVKEVARTAKTHVQQNPNTLFCCGSYTIGKEKVFLNIAEELDCKIWARKDKAKVLQCLGDAKIDNRLVTDPTQASVYVLYMKDINFQHLETVLKDAGRGFSSLVAFEPTGWTTSKVGSPSTLKKTTKGRITIYAVPYSEHSSFSELRRFVRYVQPRKIQVTVNLGKQRLYAKYFKQWLGSSGGEQASLDAFLNK